MSNEELRVLCRTIEIALDQFRRYSVTELSADETRTRLALASASRMASKLLHDKTSAEVRSSPVKKHLTEHRAAKRTEKTEDGN